LLVAIFLCAVVRFGVTITNPAGFVLVTLGFALMTSTFGLLVAALGRTPEATRGIATFATLMIVMLGGAWVPSFIFPEWLQQVSLAVPARWAIDGLDAVTWRGLGIEAALRCAGVQLGFAALFGALAAWRFGARAREALTPASQMQKACRRHRQMRKGTVACPRCSPRGTAGAHPRV
jgi:ABC-2 type transport system permease protein